MIAFTFSMAASRFEVRRQLAVEETNDIGTAWRRLDLLPRDRQPALREDFRQYVDARIAVYQNVRNAAAVKDALLRTQQLQDDIWSHAVTACDEASSFAVTQLVLASLNTMIDITTTRTIVAQTHLPWLICAFLIASPPLCGVAAGLNAAPAPRRSLVHTLGFALLISITVFLILDLDYPRVGLVRLDVFDQALVELRNSMR
jgi:hypothetical protein